MGSIMLIFPLLECILINGMNGRLISRGNLIVKGQTLTNIFGALTVKLTLWIVRSFEVLSI